MGSIAPAHLLFDILPAMGEMLQLLSPLGKLLAELSHQFHLFVTDLRPALGIGKVHGFILDLGLW